MKRILGCFIFLMIMMTSQIFAGTVYYVDATSGNDLNDGLSEISAWKTISNVNNKTFSSGDFILFKRGEIWREALEIRSSGSPNGQITFGAYGIGNKPNITATNAFTNWALINGTVYLKVGITTEPNQVFYNGSKLTENDGATSNVGLNKWDWAFNTLYINIGENPDTGTLEAGQRDYCINLTTANYITIENIRTWGANGSDNGNIRNWDNSGTNRNNIIIHDCEVDYSYAHGIRIHIANTNGIINGLDVYNNEVHHNGTGNSGYGMYFLGNGLSFQNVNIYSNITYNNKQEGIRINGGSNVEIYENYCHDEGYGATVQSACILVGSYCSSIKVYRNKLINADAEGIWVGTTGISNLEIYYNVIDGGNHFGIHIDAGTSSALIYNNSIHNHNGGIALGIIGQVTNVIIKNNIIHTLNGSSGNFETNHSSTFISNYNCWDENRNFYLNQGLRTWAQWQAIGNDINGLRQDPIFVDGINQNFNLQNTSPCIDAGVDVGLDFDIERSPVPQGFAPDIGAYEYTGENPVYAAINASPASGEVPLTVTFTGSATGGTPPYSYSWDFGDATSSTEQNPTHTYSDPGDYTVTLTVTDSDSNQDSDSLTINAADIIIPLEVSFIASPISGEVPLTVNFTGNATGGVPPYTYSWNFGDGASSSEQNPSHTYSQASDYTVTFTVTDSQSNQNSDSLTINASAVIIPLAASFIASPTSGEVPLTVNFTGSATGGTEPYTYSWDFGDSTSSNEQNPTHTYNYAGDYTVTLTVTDSNSNQDSDSLSINASTPTIPLEASCAASPTSREVPLIVNFTGNATGGVLPYSYSWDFGDGTSSSEQNPIHNYSEAGDYTVTLNVTDSENTQDSDSLTITAFVDEAYLSCSPKSIYFGATTSGNETTDQYLRIINAGSGTLTWNIEDDADWLSCTPSSGTDRGEITVSVNASGLSLGLYIATITVSSPEAYNSPQYVFVNFRVYEPEQESPPFGSLDTPVNGSTVSGSIPITGWALDDIEVVRLEIKRNSDPLDPPEAIGSDGLVYIGDAVFVEGARPDVEKSYADYPLNSRAGWGYMLLTNDLPYRGNGSFTIYGFAYDASGQREEIGRKTILCDNINRVKPFGTIDTREQGESIRGNDYVNFGWALTPLPKTIPKDGSTISVWIDGVQVGHPVYDQYREDIATLYPEYNNAQGAVGYYYLDTTQYENGVHTIAWSVMDDEGEADEIGARYFFIDNIETASVHNGSFGLRSIYREDVEGRLRIGIKEVKKEYRPQVDNDREIDTKSILNIQIEEMEPLRIVLEESSSGNMEYIGWGENKSKALPIGSTLDREKGIFSWIPTPGFIGRYVLHFVVTDGSYMSKPLQVVVNVIPKSND